MIRRLRNFSIQEIEYLSTLLMTAKRLLAEQNIESAYVSFSLIASCQLDFALVD
jgi:hypothetical protein